MGCFAPLQRQHRQTDASTAAPARQDPPCHCAACHHALGNQAVQRLLAGAQPKLKIGEPGDAFEREADRVASAALEGGPGTASLPRAPAGTTASPVGAAFGAGGTPLDRATRADMESRLGQDFRAVRVHTIGEAAASSDALAARAYTVGQDIVFAPGEYRPNDASGRRLLAHELVHTVQQREGGPRLQRKARPLAGRCVSYAEAETTLDDEATRAGAAAHLQIQAHFSDRLLAEVPLPRATKERRGEACPSRGETDGKIDLWRYTGGRAQIAEIKSVTGQSDAVPSVMHYIHRFHQFLSRMTGGECSESTADEKDVIFDMLYLGGDVTMERRTPEPVPLASVVPTTPTWIDTFALDPEKDLYCERREGGAVLYWCNKKHEDEDEDEGAQALRTLALATEKTAKRSAEKAAEKAAVGQASEKLAEKAVAEKTTEKAMSRAATRAAAEKTAESMATRKVTETATEKAAVKAAERAGTRTALETTKKAATSWAGRTLKFLGPLAARANLWLTAAELTLALAGGLAKYGYGSMYAGTRGYLLQQAFKRIAQSSGTLAGAANHAVERLYQLDLQANDESKTRQLRDEIFDALYQHRVALSHAIRSLTHNGYSERYSAIDKHIDVRGQGYALAKSQLEVADGLIADGDRSADSLQLLCSYLVDVTEWQMATVEQIFAARDAIVKEDISLWLAIKP